MIFQAYRFSALQLPDSTEWACDRTTSISTFHLNDLSTLEDKLDSNAFQLVQTLPPNNDPDTQRTNKLGHGVRRGNELAGIYARNGLIQ